MAFTLLLFDFYVVSGATYKSLDYLAWQLSYFQIGLYAATQKVSYTLTLTTSPGFDLP